ncbi:hypothetical protein CU098_012176, partial [Rhizopus stolonifer]
MKIHVLGDFVNVSSGPGLSIFVMKNSDEDALQYAPISFVLIGEITSQSRRLRVLDQTSSGRNLADDTSMHSQEFSLSFGGANGSDVGKYHGQSTFETFTQEKFII